MKHVIVLLLLLFACMAASAAKVAVLIGCNGYDVFPALRACVADVQRMQGVLKGAGYEVYTLSDDALAPDGKREVGKYFPDKRNIEKQLQIAAAAGSLGKGDTLLFFFSGHGMRSADGDDYLVPLDSGDADPAHLVKIAWVYETLRQSGAENIVIITDACRNIPGRGGDVSAGFGKAAADALGKLPAEEQRYALLRSCAEGQISYERDDAQGGRFAYYLAEGLAGAADGWGGEAKDGVITVSKAFAYAKAKVGEEARQAGEVQVPQLMRVGEAAESIPLTGTTPVVTPETPLTLRVTAPPEAADGKEVAVAGDSVTIAGVVADVPGVKVTYLGAHPDDVPLLADKDLRAQRTFSYTVSDLSPGLNTLAFEAIDADHHRQLVTVRVRSAGTRQFTDLAQRIDAAKDGDTIELAEGEYELSDELIITKSISLVGAGQDKTIIRSTARTTAIFMDTACELSLKNLTVREAGGFPANVIMVDAGTATIRQCTISGGIIDPANNNAFGIGICVSGSAQCSMFDSLVQGNEGCGIAFTDTSQGKVANTQCKDNGEHGIAALGNATLTADGNTCRNNKWCGIIFLGASQGKALNNQCQENALHGIAGEGNSTLTADSNTCQHNKKNGIFLSDACQGKVTNNQCLANDQHGIAAEGTSTLTAENNTCQNNKSCGIAFFDKAQGTQIEHNTCTGSQCGIYIGKETTVTLQENTCTDNTEQDIRQDK